MQQRGFEGFIEAEGQSESALRPAESSRSLNEVTTQRVQFLENPEWRALLGSMTVGELRRISSASSRASVRGLRPRAHPGRQSDLPPMCDSAP
jgi:hypothetical protein